MKAKFELRQFSVGGRYIVVEGTLTMNHTIDEARCYISVLCTRTK